MYFTRLPQLKNNILTSFGITADKTIKRDINKSLEVDIEKGGEGSRGGKIVGHTKTGKPIYESTGGVGRTGAHPYSEVKTQYENFSHHDHKDAEKHHIDKKNEAAKKQTEAFKKHPEVDSSHYHFGANFKEKDAIHAKHPDIHEASKEYEHHEQMASMHEQIGKEKKKAQKPKEHNTSLVEKHPEHKSLKDEMNEYKKEHGEKGFDKWHADNAHSGANDVYRESTKKEPQKEDWKHYYDKHTK